MTILKAAVLGAALSLTAACAAPFTADVSRFQRLPAPTGQSFAIVAAEEAKTGSLEFGTYARYVAGELIDEGYREVANPEAADLIVALDYGVGDPREKVATRPGSYGGFARYRYGWYGYRYPIFYDPWFYGYPGMHDRDVYSYTVYNAFLDMVIREDSGEPVFEGRAMTTSRDNDLPELVPNLVTAMFTDFPGNNGRTIRVKVPQDDR
ncbi:hypothetical protein B5C34_01510 [Pacificimonas flava]|uniref:DUF4136 domain-containing protein n=2 Tax=Pacificimonas TaxID=1960290 RepID=A0A219B864_9SPHN|nr:MULTISPECIES: DUF4136 domain-containing protein [Pacificimonas]MBZ6378106.1 DUF4136 domain-containing protein [Pacificimonas aurantium]OWV34580.1 hypothetical protein B5C34_01510 [Pacificimonas flava]